MLDYYICNYNKFNQLIHQSINLLSQAKIVMHKKKDMIIKGRK